MFSWLSGANQSRTQRTANDEELQDLRGQIAALKRAQAVIEFQLDGTILTANDNFLQAMGYTLDEVRGRHHSLFIPPEEAK